MMDIDETGARGTQVAFRKPDPEDGAAIWELIAACKPLDENSMYCNLIQCDHFRDTCILAELDGAPVGWISGYVLPTDAETFFVWQVAVSERARGLGLAKRMLEKLLARDVCGAVTKMQTTITKDNDASWALFRSFADAQDGELNHEAHFESDAHFQGAHDTEHMVTIHLPDAEEPGAMGSLPRDVSRLNQIKEQKMTKHHTIDKTIFDKRESEVRSYCRSFDAVFERAEGATLFDADGKGYTDFLAGCSSLNYGHNDPDMKAALIEHISNDGIAHALDMYTGPKAAFLETFERLVLAPRGMPHKVMMTGPTGTNAVEAAIKLARKVTGRSNVIAFTNGFHGMTLGALSLTGNAGKRGGAGVPLSGVTHLPYEGSLGDDVDTLAMAEAMLDNTSSGVDAPAAFVLELIQGEGGLTAVSPEWVEGIARLAQKHGAKLIIDDIQAGLGRSGSFFSFDDMDVEPDMITMAKSLSGFGLPFALTLIKPELDVWSPAEHNGTFRGNTHAFVTARVALEKFWSDDGFKDEIAEKSEVLTKGLQRIADMIPGARLKGRGMMQGVDVSSGDLAGAICAEAFERGLVIETSGGDDEVVKVLAPLTIPMKQFQAGLDTLAEAATTCLDTNKIAAE